MPGKFLKGFPRRKSSGNVLDDVQDNSNNNQNSNRDSGSSFRVLARPNSQGRSLEHATAPRPMTNRPQPPGKSSFELDNEDLFSVVRHDAPNRGSGGTANSLSTAQNDSAASSARLSSSSTNPSSVETNSARNAKPPGQRSYDDIPAPPPAASRSGFLKNAGRTFSFGINRNSSREINDLPPIPPIPSDKSRRSTVTNSRDRAMTASSVTTATAPRLDDSSFSIKESDDDFGNMFAGIQHKSSRENLISMRPAPLRSAQRAAPPHPIHVNNGAEVESSPYSWNSQNSRDGLIGSPSPSRTVTQASPPPSTLRNITMGSVRSEATNEDNMFEDTPLHRSPQAAATKPHFSPTSRAPPSAFPSSMMNRSRAHSNAASRSPQSDTSGFDMPAFDPALLANAQLASQYEDKQQSPVHAQSNKVMTPAEFERYKQQKEDTRRYNKVFGKADSDDGSGDDYDDEEEDLQDRENQAVKQRKKQEAHLAVYRQQMRKVTGDVPTQATVEQHRPGTSMSGYQAGNSSQFDLTNPETRMSSLTLDGRPPVPDEPEEDEDVPLGILAAHGFPNKNRPPTRLAGSSSNPNLRNLAQSQGGASTVGEPRGNLPAFARHLPADPYYGAGLVHQAERQSLAMHASPSQAHLAAQPQPSGAATAHPLHPAGLVGVIAGEERARAMRRGSPNPQGGYDMPMGAGPNLPGRGPQQMPGYPPMMVQPPMMSPAEQAQVQMSHSMTQMMQMQMQWMQQMTSMMGQNPSMQMPMMGMPGMPQMPPTPNGVPVMQQPPNSTAGRPQSVPLQQFNGGNQQRTMSTLSPSMAGWARSSPAVPQMNGNGPGYAPSIAPSERSNVGLASRYRPVSTMNQETENNDWGKRASTFTSSTFRPYTNENNQPKLANSTIRNVHNADDEDEEQGWAEMKARREKKQKSWKLRKGGNNTLQELYNAPA